MAQAWMPINTSRDMEVGGADPRQSLKVSSSNGHVIQKEQPKLNPTQFLLPWQDLHLLLLSFHLFESLVQPQFEHKLDDQ